MVIKVAVMWAMSLGAPPLPSCACASPWATVRVRPGLTTRPVNANRAPLAGARRLTLNSTVSTAASAGISENAA